MIVWRVYVLSTQHAICMHACGIVPFPFRHSNVKTLKQAIDINHRLKFIFYASYNCIHTTCRRVVFPCQQHPAYDAACANNAINTFNTDNNVSISHHEFGASLNVNEHWTHTANRATNCNICILTQFETSWHRKSTLQWYVETLETETANFSHFDWFYAFIHAMCHCRFFRPPAAMAKSFILLLFRYLASNVRIFAREMSSSRSEKGKSNSDSVTRSHSSIPTQSKQMW